MRRFSHPRGALLLVILALLAMFGLVAVALVVLVQSARRNALAMVRLEQANDPPPQQLDAAMRQVIRGDNISPVVGPTGAGTACTGSAIGAHSLLEEMYGNLCITGTVNPGAPSTVCGNQLWSLAITGTPFTAGGNPFVTFPPGVNASTPLGGRVITMTSGAAAGQSSLIVDASPTYGGVGGGINGINYKVMAFDNGVVPNSGDQFTINGVPFSGAGFGYDPTSGSLGATPPTSPPAPITDSGAPTGAYPIALLPGYPLANYPITSGASVYPAATGYRNPPGGANSDYTAADFRHMLLAAQQPAATGAGVVPTMNTPIPSLHRPALIQYWAQNNGGTWAGIPLKLQRMIMLRPNSQDHPNFTGSNPNVPFDPVNGPWDVDNDGDGVADSVWVDLGMPVRATADGRLYKPLFAILCVDLDGRLNVNAHGAGPVAMNDTARFTPQTVSGGGGYTMSVGTGPAFGGGKLEYPYSAGYLGSLCLAPTATTAPVPLSTATLPRALGYGPAEVSLLPLFGSMPLSSTQLSCYNSLFLGVGTYAIASGGTYVYPGSVSLPGRYGEFSPTSMNNTVPMPGISYTGGSSFTSTISPLTYNKWWNYSGNYWEYVNGVILADAFGAPPDFAGIGAVGLDPAGQPLYMSAGNWLANSPYDIDLSRWAGRACRTTAITPIRTRPATILSARASWSGCCGRSIATAPALPSRLAMLTTSNTADLTQSLLMQKRYEATTDSWDVPCPAVAVPLLSCSYLATAQLASTAAGGIGFRSPRSTFSTY